MKSLKRILSILVILCVLPLSSLNVSAIGDAENMLPLWSSKIIYNESIFPYSSDGLKENADLPLLFTPLEIISVKNSKLDTTYVEGVDYTFTNGVLKLTSTSSIACQTESYLFPTTTTSYPRVGGGYVFFAENTVFPLQQIAITYRVAGNEWTGSIPSVTTRLPKTMEKLQTKSDLKVVLTGDSISQGYNASNFFGIAPYMDSWGKLFTSKLSETYGSKITFINSAIAGETSTNGKTNVAKYVTDYTPDLVIIAYGMNDNSGDLATYKANIQAIISAAKLKNSEAEFLLVSPMSNNPNIDWAKKSPTIEKIVSKFNAVLKEIQDESTTGIQLVDMTSTHAEILEKKRYVDTTGNNVNHPNDYLIRWYAQMAYYTLAPVESNHLIFNNSFVNTFPDPKKLVGTVASNMEISNSFEGDKTATVINALYNANNELVKVYCKNVSVPALTSITSSESFDITEASSKYTVKTMVVDSLTNMKPLTDVKSTTLELTTAVKDYDNVNVAAATNNPKPVAWASSTSPKTSTINYDVQTILNGITIGGSTWGKSEGWNDNSSGIFPDIVEINFNQGRVINQIDLYTLPDVITNNVTEPTLTDTFTKYGISDFDLEYWNGVAWYAIPEGHITGNRNVWKQIKFSEVTANKIRIIIKGSVRSDYSRIIEMKARLTQ